MMREAVVARGDGSEIGVGLVGDPGGSPLLVCHGLADSRLAAETLESAAQTLGLLVIAPDRPGIGRSEYRPLSCVSDWVDDARLVLDGLGIDVATILGVSAGGPFAAACAALMPDRVSALLVVSTVGQITWVTTGMTASGRAWTAIAARAPAVSAWLMGRLAALARWAPELFMSIQTGGLPAIDRAALTQPERRAAYIAGYLDAFRSGTAGVAQDLRVLTRDWGFELGAISVPTWIHHGDEDATSPSECARRFLEAIPGAELRLHAGHGHFSLDLATPGVLEPAVASP